MAIEAFGEEPPSFGEWLREQRLAKGLSQEALARELDVKTVSTIRNWERGRGEPQLRHYLALCRLFDWPEPPFTGGLSRRTVQMARNLRLLTLPSG